MKATPEILSLAVRAGMVAGRDVISGVTGAVPVTRTNGVHCVQRSGRPLAYAKQPGVASRLDGDDVVAAERSALTRLRHLGLTPPLIPQGGPAVVWTAAVRGTDLTTLSLDQQSALRLSHALGAALVALHRAPVDPDVPTARAPWPLLDAPLASMTTHPAGPDRDAVLATWREPVVRAALAPLRDSWARAARWTHGDLSASNVFVDGDSRITFVDWESAGRGDPCWDLVSLEQSLTSIGLPLHRFRRAYAAGGGPALPCPSGWRTVRFLVTAWQYAAAPGADHHRLVERLLTDARASARASDFTRTRRSASPMQEASR
ncbi:phosphotransferase family protein [Flexivirga sp.]|uniref:phosphotransferase family protein n=1 Tax=Flexivirga sp. TaxID=1962927 RepID=UPI003F7D5A50